ncbi:MAG: FecR domain-containing protein [Bacteroidota bacterium]
MTKQEFFKLLEKFEKGGCSKVEKELLFKFSEQVQLKKFLDNWSLSEKEQARIRLFDRINSSINEVPQERSTFLRILRPWRVAAILFMPIGITLTFFFITEKRSIEIPKDAITLELEDGVIQIIKENGEIKVLDKNGNIVGKQDGNRLDYSDAKTTNEELTYNTLTIPYGKRFELLLSDGTKVHLNAGSSLKYPVRFLEGMKREVYVSGEAYMDVSRDTVHPFIVEADGINVRVLGTQFNVYAYPEDTVTEIVLVEGAVSLYSEYGGSSAQPTLLEPGQMGSYDTSSNHIQRKEVLTNIYTSWRNGELVFRNMTFGNIVKKLERHYNVVIENNDTELTKTIFNASFGNEPLINVLEGLKENYGMQYTIEGQKITIN